MKAGASGLSVEFEDGETGAGAGDADGVCGATPPCCCIGVVESSAISAGFCGGERVGEEDAEDGGADDGGIRTGEAPTGDTGTAGLAAAGIAAEGLNSGACALSCDCCTAGAAGAAAIGA